MSASARGLVLLMEVCFRCGVDQGILQGNRDAMAQMEVAWVDMIEAFLDWEHWALAKRTTTQSYFVWAQIRQWRRSFLQFKPLPFTFFRFVMLWLSACVMFFLFWFLYGDCSWDEQSWPSKLLSFVLIFLLILLRLPCPVLFLSASFPRVLFLDRLFHVQHFNDVVFRMPSWLNHEPRPSKHEDWSKPLVIKGFSKGWPLSCFKSGSYDTDIFENSSCLADHLTPTPGTCKQTSQLSQMTVKDVCKLTVANMLQWRFESTSRTLTWTFAILMHQMCATKIQKVYVHWC